jgi:hypothetical protein
MVLIFYHFFDIWSNIAYILAFLCAFAMSDSELMAREEVKPDARICRRVPVLMMMAAARRR